MASASALAFALVTAVSPRALGAVGSPDCWAGPFSFEACCLPFPEFNFQCFDESFTPERCCGDAERMVALGGCLWRGEEPDPPFHDLGQLFRKYGTDKGYRHQYHKFYSSALESYRYSSTLVIEVGIGSQAEMGYPAGQGLRAWREYFPSAQVVGLDVNPEAAILGEARISTVVPLDSTKPWSVAAELAGVVRTGGADVIVDDGAHDPVHQGETLTSMWGFLRDGGLYLIEDLEFKYADRYGVPESLSHLGRGATHHLCGMRVARPFVFGEFEEMNYTPPGLEHFLEGNGAFYISLKIGHEKSNIIVLPKNWPQEDLIFGHVPGSYRMAYNVIMRGALPRVVIVQEPSQASLWRSAFPAAAVRLGPVADGCDVDVLVTSAQSPRFGELLRDFGRLRRGGFLFVEDISFSFCDGAPDPAVVLPLARGIIAANPDWFYVMAQDEWPLDSIPDFKLLVVRRA